MMPRRSLGSWTHSTSSARRELVGVYIAPISLARQEACVRRQECKKNTRRTTTGIGQVKIRGPHGYADMNTMFFSWVISMNIPVLLKFHGYEYGYAPNIHEYS
jgi:hypothetical protein